MKRTILDHWRQLVPWSVCLMAILLCSPAHAVGFSAPGTQHCYNSVTTGTTFSCAMPVNPTSGSVVLVHISTFQALTLSTVQDSAGTPNAYSKGCSATNDSQSGTDCSAYFIANGTADKTVTATVTGGTCGACSIEVMEIKVTGGTASFDKSDFTGHGTDAVTTPTLTPAGTGELFFGTCDNGNSCTGVTGSWTAGPNGLGSFAEECEYQLSVGSATAVGFTGVVANLYDSTELAFQFTASGATANPGPRVIGE